MVSRLLRCRLALADDVERDLMGLVGGRDAAVERNEQQDLLDLLGEQPFLSAPLRWTRSSLGLPSAAIIVTIARLFVVAGSASRCHTSP